MNFTDIWNHQFSSVAQSCPTLCDPRRLQCARLPCPSPFPIVCSNSCSLNRWCYPTISSLVFPFSSCPQSCPASESFPRIQFFRSGDQSFGASASASFLPMNIQAWFPSGLTGLISLLSKGLSKVYLNTAVENNQFFGVQLSLWSNSHIHTQLLKNHSFDYMDLCW